MNSKFRLFPVFLLLLAIPLGAGAQAIEVTPLAHDFGEVELDSSSTTIITIQNLGDDFLIVNNVYIQAGSPEFTISQLPSLPAIINPPDGSTIYSISVEVTFTPPAVGSFSGALVVESNDPGSPTVTVALQGTGVSTAPPPTSVAEMLAFYDASVANGTLVGSGPGKSADGRRNALRNKIEAAGDLIDSGNIGSACNQLWDAYQRTDGLPMPPEFVAGPAASTLASMILNLMGSLGCQ